MHDMDAGTPTRAETVETPERKTGKLETSKTTVTHLPETQALLRFSFHVSNSTHNAQRKKRGEKAEKKKSKKRGGQRRA